MHCFPASVKWVQTYRLGLGYHEHGRSSSFVTVHRPKKTSCMSFSNVATKIASYPLELHIT